MVAATCPVPRAAPDLSAVLDGTDARLARITVRRMGVSRRLGNYADAMQVARLALVVAARSFDPARGSSWRSWAVTLIRQRVGDFIRQQVRAGFRGVPARTAPALAGESPDEAFDGLVDREAAEPGELAVAAWEAVQSLRPRERVVLGMRFSRGLNYREIGDLLGVTHQRASQIADGALVKLRRVLSAQR
jgi:RNA polymerase sigma factor (sigma-70 family)